MDELEKLSTEELEQLLRDDFAGKTNDPEQVQKILEILEARENASEAETEAAWQDQQTYFQTPDGERSSLFSEEAPPRRKKHGLLRLVATVAVLAVVLCSAIPPSVSAEEADSLLGRWSKNVFWFDGKTSTPDDPAVQRPEYQAESADLWRIYNAVSEYDIGPVVPAWIPEGYTIEDWDDFGTYATISEDGERHEIGAEFTRGKEFLTIRIFISEAVPNVVYEKDEAEVIVYRKNGTEYHIMSNNEQYVCAWYCGTYGGSIVGNVTLEELYRMIDSIYEGK